MPMNHINVNILLQGRFEYIMNNVSFIPSKVNVTNVNQHAIAVIQKEPSSTIDICL